MRCGFINLDRALERRARLEESFRRYGKAGWTLGRFPALSAGHVEDAGVAGRLRPAEKACFLSHLHLLERLSTDDGHCMILEDDAVFGPRSCQLIDAAITTIPDGKWDILFTDVCLPKAKDMMNIFALRRSLLSGGQTLFRVIDLKGWSFAGATAYVVNGRSKRKLSGLLRRLRSYDCPYDLFLRDATRASLLSAYMVFPFATSLSEAADQSQIQNGLGDPAEIIWNTFRKLVWIDRSLDDLDASLRAIETMFGDRESAILGTLLSAMASPAATR
ncbi:hypothetical protein STVA_18560 [Allostella vacuolata]|nr:hypothetical protein STVA_18560 [Stella vacuolata]